MIIHGGKNNKCCNDGLDNRHWFKCGACGRKCCYCFGGDSELKSFVNLCNDCWAHAEEQAKVDGIDPEQEAHEIACKDRMEFELKSVRRRLYDDIQLEAQLTVALRKP